MDEAAQQSKEGPSPVDNQCPWAETLTLESCEGRRDHGFKSHRTMNVTDIDRMTNPTSQLQATSEDALPNT
jgi:hypothetical protein